MIGRISADIESRQVELETLLEQKKSHDINRDREVDRLTALKQSIADDIETISRLPALQEG